MAAETGGATTTGLRPNPRLNPRVVWFYSEFASAVNTWGTSIGSSFLLTTGVGEYGFHPRPPERPKTLPRRVAVSRWGLVTARALPVVILILRIRGGALTRVTIMAGDRRAAVPAAAVSVVECAGSILLRAARGRLPAPTGIRLRAAAEFWAVRVGQGMVATPPDPGRQKNEDPIHVPHVLTALANSL